MRSRAILRRVRAGRTGEGAVGFFIRGGRRQKYHIEDLLAHERHRQVELLGDAGGRQGLVDEHPPRQGSRKKERPRKHIGLQLPPLMGTVILNTLQADRRGFY